MRPRMPILSITLLILIRIAAPAFSQPTVTVTGGAIKGAVLEQGGVVFKGIPYAAPPVGDLRWREPQPVQTWSGVRDATAAGPSCQAQEDCLYLNVWNAEWPVSKKSKPVMLWIHGGGNFGGTSLTASWDGESLSRRDVIVVGANYRLGIFGFFAHPALTKESPRHASGNYGLMDQIAAMRWIQANIKQFGGDPNNVTVFGESAGSMDINMLMASPLTKGLVQRVIELRFSCSFSSGVALEAHAASRFSFALNPRPPGVREGAEYASRRRAVARSRGSARS